MCIDGKVTEIVFKCFSIFCGLRMANLKKKLDSSKLNSIHNEDYCFFFSSHEENISAGPNMTMHGYLRKREHSCWKCVRQTQTSGMRREGESNVWFNSPFSLIGRVGNTYPFCALHWDSGRFMLMNAPDSTIWPLQGNSRSTIEAQFHLAPPLQYGKGKSE